MHTIGVDIGGTSVRAGVVTMDGSVLDTTRAPTPDGQQSLETTIVSLVDELLIKHHVVAVGLAVAGFVSTDRRRVMFAPHLAWRGTDVVGRLSSRLGLPVVLEHDTNAAALAEHRFGAAHGASVVVLITIGTGIGGALLIGGELFRGGHGVAPEFGHLRLVPQGRSCPCGKHGCWERYCSGTALSTTAIQLIADSGVGVPSTLAQYIADDAGTITGSQVAAAARAGDMLAQQAMADLSRWLGEGLALIADLYDPEVVVIGGGVARSASLFLDDARAHYVAQLTGAGYRPLARIHTARLGAEAGIVGAALLAGDLA
jgi:glucokinase